MPQPAVLKQWLSSDSKGETLSFQAFKAEPSWLQETVFYQIFPERFFNGDKMNDPFPLASWGKEPQFHNFFGGDLAGITQKIPYLLDLGVNALYLNPIFDAPSNHKYDTRDYLRIAPEFGDLRSYLRMVDKLHASGIRLILDGVFNHTGDQFWAFRDLLCRGKASPYKGWYHCRHFPVKQTPAPNYECWWGIGDLPKLNFSEPEVLRYLLRAIAFWTLTGIDGWRLDVPNEIAPQFWQVFRNLVKELNSEAYIVGEIWGNAAFWLQGNMFDATMNYPLRDLIISFFARGEMTADEFDRGLAELRTWYAPSVTGSMFNLLGSHDTSRFLTVCQGKRERFLLAVLFLFTYPGAPVIYYGDEIGMTGEKDPDCRKTMIWDETLWENEIRESVKRLVRLRREKTPLKTGGFKTAFTGQSGVYGYWRICDHQRLLVLFNRTGRMKELLLPVPRGVNGIGQRIYPRIGRQTNLEYPIPLHLPPWSGGIWEFRL